MQLRREGWFIIFVLTTVFVSILFAHAVAQETEPTAVEPDSVASQEIEPDSVVSGEPEKADEPEQAEEPQKAEEPEALEEQIFTWADSLKIKEAVLCEEVENREPEYIGTTFSKDVELVYCYTVVQGAQGTTTIKHVWYFGDKKMGAIPLKIKKSKRWRTWSNKTILPEWTGKWKVDIVSVHGRVLKSVAFEIE